MKEFPAPTELVVDNPDLTVEGASFRITTVAYENNRVAVPGRRYIIERRTSTGEWVQMRRIQSFKFECSASTSDLGTLTIVQVDFDPIQD